MQITKLEHACLVIELNDKRVIIDPGNYTRDVSNFSNVLAVVFTHIHEDHCSEEQVAGLVANNPDLIIYGTFEVQSKLTGYQVVAVSHGDFYEVGDFTFEFFGDMHAEIHRSIPLIQNCGVLINGKLYYPGDSFTQPDREIELLACPTSAPWLKISDVIDFVSTMKPHRSFATHNIHLSEIGHDLNNGRLKMATESAGGEFFYLEPGQSKIF